MEPLEDGAEFSEFLFRAPEKFALEWLARWKGRVDRRGVASRGSFLHSEVRVRLRGPLKSWTHAQGCYFSECPPAAGWFRNVCLQKFENHSIPKKYLRGVRRVLRGVQGGRVQRTASENQRGNESFRWRSTRAGLRASTQAKERCVETRESVRCGRF